MARGLQHIQFEAIILRSIRIPRVADCAKDKIPYAGRYTKIIIVGPMVMTQMS